MTNHAMTSLRAIGHSLRLAPFALLAIAAAPAPAAAPDRLTAEHRVALRCGAVFAITAGEQARGLPQARQWPAMTPRGREYFVRTAAQIIDQTGMTRAEIAAAAGQDAQAVQAQVRKARDPSAAFAGQMRACLPLLDAVVPVNPKR